jgi:uncharacterized cupin superfamily protein
MAERGIPIHVDDVPVESWDTGELAVTARRRLGKAAGALTLGVSLFEIPPGKRSTPPHTHADEEEAFLVLAGSGLSYQSVSSKDVRAYEIGADDLLLHPCDGPAHTLIAGPEGLTVLALAEGSRSSITYMPRTRMFWLGARWSPADAPHPFAADAALGPLEVPDPSPRPDTIVNLRDIPLQEGREGRIAYASRFLRTDRLVLGHDAMPADTHNTDLHWHSTREEAWFVRGGSGIARRGDETYELRAGSFWLEPPNLAVGHRIEVGPDGMDLITMGDLVAGDVCVYPEKRTYKPARGIEIGY